MTYWALRTSRPVTSSITPSSDPAETTTWITRSLLRLLPSLGSWDRMIPAGWSLFSVLSTVISKTSLTPLRFMASSTV